MRPTTEAESSKRHRVAMREASAKLPHHHLVDTDPEDPSQQLDDTGAIYVEPLAVDARPSAEASEDFDLASMENLERDLELQDEATADAAAELAHDTGELYGIRTPHAGDTDLSAPEDRDSFEGAWLGESWLESLEEHAAEMGPAPEEEIVIVDSGDHSPAEGRDRPIADKGSGGPSGL
jgi:hypothetical protein